jgi:hypothetical protein
MLSQNTNTVSPEVYQAIRYHIEMADDCINTAIDQGDDLFLGKQNYIDDADHHITAAELVLKHGLDEFGDTTYYTYCYLHSIRPYDREDLEQRRLEDLADRDPDCQ